MSIKYSCDVCNKEAIIGEKILLMGSGIKIRTLCLTCWVKAEKILISSQKIHSKLGN